MASIWHEEFKLGQPCTCGIQIQSYLWPRTVGIGFFQGHNDPAILRLSKTYSTMTLSMSNLACGMVGIMWDLRSSH